MHKVGDIYNNPNSVEVESFAFHPGWNSSADNNADDMAIIKLKRPVTFSNDLRPVCLPTGPQSVTGNQLFLIGFGMQNKGKEKVDATVLYKAHIPLRQLQDCINTWHGNGNHKFNSVKEICAGSETSACQGDSGGPLSIRRNGRVFQLGVVSFGTASCNLESKAANVYMKVTAYLDWIRENTSDGQYCAGGAFGPVSNSVATPNVNHYPHHLSPMIIDPHTGVHYGTRNPYIEPGYGYPSQG